MFLTARSACEMAVWKSHTPRPVADAAVGGDFIAIAALGLEAAEFGGVFVEEARGLIAGAVYGELAFRVGGLGLHGVIRLGGWLGGEFAFEFAAAAEAPHGSQDFFDEAAFEHALRGEFGDYGILKVSIEGLLFRKDVIGGGIETGGGGVLR